MPVVVGLKLTNLLKKVSQSTLVEFLSYLLSLFAFDLSVQINSMQESRRVLALSFSFHLFTLYGYEGC